MANMLVPLQQVVTESFNVVTADAIAAGVPTVTSGAIDWAPPLWQAGADDSGNVAGVAECLVKSPRAIDDGRGALTAYVDAELRARETFLAPSA
jgi:hypothetical protein